MKVYDHKTGQMVEKGMGDVLASAKTRTALNEGNTGLYGSTIEGADPTAIDDRRFDWNDLGAGGYAILNELLLGAPDVIAGLFGSENVKALKNWQQQNKMATDIGATIGGLGGLLIPGGTLTKGAGKALGLGAKALGTGSKIGGTLAKGAKAADLLGDVIRGGSKAADAAGSLGKLGKFANTGFGRGVLSAAEAGIPGAAMDVITGREDVGGALGNLAGGAAFGGALGGVFGKLGSKTKAGGNIVGIDDYGTGVGRGLEEITDTLTAKNVAARTGITGQQLVKSAKAYRGAKRGMSYVAENGDDIIKGIQTKLDDFGIESPLQAKAFHKKIKDVYRTLGDQMADAGIDIAPAIKQGIASDEVNEWLTRYANQGAGEKLKEILEGLPTKNYGAAKEYLNGAARKVLNNADTAMKAESVKVLDSISNSLDDLVEAFAAKTTQNPEQLANMKRAYSLAMDLEGALIGDFKESLAQRGGGSPTFEKALAGSILGGALGGNDQDDPDALKNKLLSMAGGAIVGGAANKAIPFLKNKAIGKLAGAGTKVLTPGRLGGLAEAIEKATPKLETMGGLAGARGVRSATYDSDAKAREAEAKVTATEEATTPAAQKEAAAAVNANYADVIEQRLRAGYQMYFANQMDYDTFVSEVARATNNFDPKMAAGIIFDNPEEREQYLKSYDRAMQLKEVDLAKAMQGATPRQWYESIPFIGTTPDPMAAKSYDDLVNLISSVSGSGALPSKAEKEAIRELVGNIMAQPVSDDEKRAMIEKMLSVQFGLPVDLYRKAGIYG